MDIRELTCMIIRKDGAYLVGTVMNTKLLRWSESAYDAWRTKRRADAEKMARFTGGRILIFNPGTGEVGEL